MKLIRDLGMLYPTKNSKSKKRFGLFLCSGCDKEVRAQTYSDGRIKQDQKLCSYCYRTREPMKDRLVSRRWYNIWRGQKERCSNKNHIDWDNYGGRGISISDEFKDFLVWEEYVDSLDGYKEGYTIDRINNNGNYERGNLRWASKSVQCCNRRKFKSNTSGYTGVQFIKGKYHAIIQVDGVRIRLGVFKRIFDAVLIRDMYILNNNLNHTLNTIGVGSEE
jgi:hypothetical protein